MAATNDMNTLNILGIYSTQHIMLELCVPVLMDQETVKLPSKYMYIRNWIPVLDLHSVQYTCWSSLFRDVAWSKNLLHHIDPTVPAPPPDINISIDDHTTLWCEQDAVVLTWIYATISPYLLKRLLTEESITTTSAMDAWARLRNICQQHDTTMQRKKRRFIHIDLNEDYQSPGDNDNDDRVDFLSNLPDHLLIYILSLAADIKTAGRTSILSKRWTRLWTDLMDLDFDDLETSATIKNFSFAQPEMNKFVDLVDQVIAANRAPYLGTFRINFPLNGFYAAHIENWLKFAFVKKVRNLELNFFNLDLDFFPSYSRNIHFLKIFSDNPASILNTTLKSLHLKSVRIERNFLQWVITNCLNLQSLLLHGCDDASSKHRLKLVISSLKLKHLEIFYCLKSLKIDSLHLSAPNLTSFICNEFKIDVEYRSVPSLVDVTFGGLYFHHLKALSGFSSQLKKLSIVWDEVNRAPSNSIFPINSVPINSRFPTFVNVQQLEIISSHQDVYLLSATSLMEACPLMHTFKLKLMCRTHLEGPWNSLAANKTQFNIMWHLKTVEYLGYAGCSFAAQLALCLTRLAPMLRRFIFDTRQPQFFGKPCEIYTSDHRDQMVARSRTELLAECIRGSHGHVDVVILIAQGDVALSIVMTVCTTLGAVLTKILVGTYVPVDALKLSVSTLQVVVLPILLGSYMQSKFPKAVKLVTPFSPLFTVLAASLLACSVFAENVVHLKSSMTSASLSSDLSLLLHLKTILSSELGVTVLAVLLLHFAGFFVGD